MIVDCFSFFNEVSLLSFRLKYLSDAVDRFVIVESKYTHTGLPKPLYLKSLIDGGVLHEHKDKIVHVVVDQFPETTNPWTREFIQRNRIMEGLNRIAGLKDDDMILISDADEIPERTIIQYLVPGDYGLIQTMYYYNAEFMQKNQWNKARFVRWRTLKNVTPTKLRLMNMVVSVPCGWHFSYFGDEKHIIKKIESFTHQELNTDEVKDERRLAQLIEQGRSLQDGEEMMRVPIERNPTLPRILECPDELSWKILSSLTKPQSFLSW
jgi:beta-1,4-mannosyl-glycoprotein beta-1,4-N-acetylglucosaminyltransferase